MLRPQTIQIFLPTGDPRGMRVAEITTRIVRVIEVPRSQLADFLKMPEALQVGVYSLGGRHNLWDHRYQVTGQNTARFKVVLIHTSDRSVLWVFETIKMVYAVRLAQAWVQAFEKKDPDTKVKLLAIQKDGTVRDCPSSPSRWEMRSCSTPSNTACTTCIASTRLPRT